MNHQPVMLPEAVAALDLGAGKRFVDCTFGAGGYSKAILDVAGTELLALDRDPNVIQNADSLRAAYPDRFFFRQATFSDLRAALQDQGWDKVDGIVLDVGVSSMQIDQAERGFSFLRDGPLDMRMSQTGISAADVVNQMDGQDLIRIFRVYGEEKRARRAAEAILAARQDAPFRTTGQLADVLESALGPKKSRIHPATKVFQAWRIFVNDELGELARLLVVAESMLRPMGRLVVVAFHSLEDRLVKTFLRTCAEAPSIGSRHAPASAEPSFVPSFTLIKRKVILPSDAEIASNVRARSARLRWAQRTDAAPFDVLPDLPNIPSLAACKDAS